MSTTSDQLPKELTELKAQLAIFANTVDASLREECVRLLVQFLADLRKLTNVPLPSHAPGLGEVNSEEHIHLIFSSLDG